MNKLKTIMAACAACALTSTAMAADPDGTINFTGEIISGSCKVIGAGAGNSVPVDLGRVLISDIETAGAGNKVNGATIKMELDCSSSSAGLKTVKFKFDPTSGSGLDTVDNRLLKITGAATGVGIGLYDGSGQIINLSDSSKEYSAALTTAAGGTAGNNKYTATMNMSASYVGNGAALEAGAAAGTLPFTLTYD